MKKLLPPVILIVLSLVLCIQVIFSLLAVRPEDQHKYADLLAIGLGILIGGVMYLFQSVRGFSKATAKKLARIMFWMGVGFGSLLLVGISPAIAVPVVGLLGALFAYLKLGRRRSLSRL